jgi:hypothetical protein
VYLSIPLTIQVCWFVVICMCSKYQSHRLVPGDWLSVCYRKQSFTCWCCSNVCCTMHLLTVPMCGIVCLKRDGTRAETRFHLLPKWTSPFKSVGASVWSTAGSRGVRISVSSAGYTTFRGSVRVLAAHSIHQFPLHFPSRTSLCAIRFQTHSNNATV